MMLVVLPVCTKDESLALLNLELCQKLDGTCPFDCLVCSETGFDDSRVIREAKKYFKGVYRTQYPPCPRGLAWPAAPNHAWQNAAKAVASFRQSPWLWWEQDAVPLRKGWLEEIEAAYVEGKKPLAGCVVRDGAIPQPYLAGVAVYPANIAAIAPQAMASKSTPFDLAVSTVDRLMGQVHDISGVLQHVFHPKGDGWKVGMPIPQVALYHRCKNGDLQNTLLGRVTVAKDIQLVTVVITSHNRRNRLERAYQSCLDCGVRDIVIAATGYDDLEKDTLLAIFPQARIVWGEGDDSNSAWLEGVRAANTPWVHILHDDDMLLPEFRGIEQHLTEAFLYFPAAFHRETNAPKSSCTSPVAWDGITNCDELAAALRVKDSLSITPVRGCFRRTDLVQWLEEAGRLLPESCYLRPGFLVGNDLWIWLSAARKYKTFRAVNINLVSLGCDTDSTTVCDMSKSKGKVLPRIYNTTRRIFDGQSGKASPLGLHIFTIVLDGLPWLMGQLQIFNRLKVDWHWTIVLGKANPLHCTHWCKGFNGKFKLDTDALYTETAALLDDLRRHPRITMIERFEWNGKLEMINSIFGGRSTEEVLLEVDCDEFWEAQQLEKMVQLFQAHPEKTHAMFWCRFFVGPARVMVDRGVYANYPESEWKRAWRWIPGVKFKQHEPPKLDNEQAVFTHAETEAEGLVFDHYAYASQRQVQFKEHYYGYPGAVESWKKLQQCKAGDLLESYFGWAKSRPGGRIQVL